MMCICYSLLCTCIYMYLYELYLSECLSSNTLQKPLLFTGEGQLLAYMGIFCKQLSNAIQIQKRLLYHPRTSRIPRVFFYFISHGATLLFDCIYSSTNSGLRERISEEEAVKMSPKTPMASNSVARLLTRPDKCKGCFLLHTTCTHKMSSRAFFILRPSLTSLCVALLLLSLLRSQFQPCPTSVFFFP